LKPICADCRGTGHTHPGTICRHERPTFDLQAIRDELPTSGPTVGDILDALMALRDRFRLDPVGTEQELREVGWPEADIQKFKRLAVYG
jgi:hypothetical protein